MTSICFGQETLYYLIYRDILSGIIPISVIKAKGRKSITAANGKPRLITGILRAPNTNYMLIRITPRNSTEENFIANLVSQGAIYLHKRIEIITDSNDRKYPKKTIVQALPADYYDVWASTP
jgi:hypothetical protein